MLMNDKIVFDRHYCINSAKTKEIMVHFILHSCHIFICIKSFILMLIQGRLQILIISMSFGWPPVSSIIKCHVLIACAQVNRYINKWLFSSLMNGC